MQKIATRVFIYGSIVFGILGIIQVMTLPGNNQQLAGYHLVLMRLLMATVIIILTSFALSVAGKYLKTK